MNFISMAAYDLNASDKKAAGAQPPVFTAEMAAKTRVKIEAVFAACLSQGIDILVLGALGCG